MKLSKKEFDGFIIGCVLGDASLCGKANKYIYFGHAENQKEYLEWKMGVVKDNLNVGFSYNKEGYINNSGYCVESRQKLYKAFSTSHHRLTSIYKQVYIDGKKHMTKDLLERMGVIGLAMFFMDDGCKETYLNKNKTTRLLKTFKFSLGNFTMEEANMFSDFLLEKYGIASKVYLDRGKYPNVKITTKENREKFVSLISPYVNLIECMKYKINV